jgi:hypothetical protein
VLRETDNRELSWARSHSDHAARGPSGGLSRDPTCEGRDGSAMVCCRVEVPRPTQGSPG